MRLELRLNRPRDFTAGISRPDDHRAATERRARRESNVRAAPQRDQSDRGDAVIEDNATWQFRWYQEKDRQVRNEDEDERLRERAHRRALLRDDAQIVQSAEVLAHEPQQREDDKPIRLCRQQFAQFPIAAQRPHGKGDDDSRVDEEQIN